MNRPILSCIYNDLSAMRYVTIRPYFLNKLMSALQLQYQASLKFLLL
jgi:hypothetical protein